MKKLLIIFIIFGVVSCGKTSLNAELGQPFKMGYDQRVKVVGTDLKLVGFTVSEDSRCPIPANCFWEGQVVAEFDMDGAPLTFNSFKSFDTLGYTFQIKSVTPEKKEGVDIPLSSYILEILITK